MSDPVTPAAPATPAAVANVPNPPPAPTEAETRRAELVKLNAQAIETCTEQGRQKGVTEGRKLELDRAKAIADVCPGKPEMALNAILSNQNPAAVKMAFDAAVMAESKAKTENEALQAEIDRWRALATIGGHPGVAVSLATEDSKDSMDPKSRAEWEWDNDPEARKSARTKDIYVIARTAELDGTHRSVRPVGA